MKKLEVLFITFSQGNIAEYCLKFNFKCALRNINLVILSCLMLYQSVKSCNLICNFLNGADKTQTNYTA